MSLTWLFTNLAASLLLPPLNGLLPAGLGFLLLRRRPRAGRWLVGLGLLAILLQALPITGKALLQPLETRHPPLDLAAGHFDAEAVVVLGSGRYRHGPDFGGADDLKQFALERVRYGALVAKASGLPLLVTGGHPEGPGPSEAELMARVLARDFGVVPRWQEGESNNTRENAGLSAAMLAQDGVRRIILVTHAFHMPRAVAAFERAGLAVVPAPMAYLSAGSGSLALDYLPNYAASRDTALGLHEWIGLFWYGLRG